jgi:hypothetical protein
VLFSPDVWPQLLWSVWIAAQQACAEDLRRHAQPGGWGGRGFGQPRRSRLPPRGLHRHRDAPRCSFLACVPWPRGSLVPPGATHHVAAKLQVLHRFFAKLQIIDDNFCGRLTIGMPSNQQTRALFLQQLTGVWIAWRPETQIFLPTHTTQLASENPLRSNRSFGYFTNNKQGQGQRSRPSHHRQCSPIRAPPARTACCTGSRAPLDC